MGLLTAGRPLTWKDSEPHRQRVKSDGITQFLHAYEKVRDRRRPMLKWGDEVEYALIMIDETSKTARLCVRAPEVIEELQVAEHLQISGESSDIIVETLWRPEYANWMVEGTPGTPYRSFIRDLTLVEKNMALRRAEIQGLLGDNELVLSLTAYPRLGCKQFTDPPKPVYGKYARSFYTSDMHINPHPRFRTLTRNIRLRRGSKVDIHMPLFMDENTPELVPVVCDECDPGCVMPPEEVTIDDHAYQKIEDACGEKKDDVYMDSMAFGMGCSCLQVTLQCTDIGECRHLYDQLHVVAPILLALTAACPAIRGYLLDTDVRWNIIAGSVDDRTPEEAMGKIGKSRYDSIDLYISDRKAMIPDIYNDIPIAVDENAYKRLRDGGVDDLLAQHIAHLFIRDPLVIFEDHLAQDNETDMGHFENIQSTNWNTVRFKPPPPDSDIGWRTEFRSMEVQFTDFENAAFSIFIVLLSRVIIAFDLNLYMPISKVDENMQIAHERNAAESGRFYFRRNIFGEGPHKVPSFVCCCGHVHVPKFSWPSEFDDCGLPAEALELMTLDEIFNGTNLSGPNCNFAFPGFIPLIRTYLHALGTHADNQEIISKIGIYLDFVSDKANGTLWTTAKWMRHFVETHPSYRKDSRVTEEINYDLMQKIDKLSRGEIEIPELVGSYFPKNKAGLNSAAELEKIRQEVGSTDAKLRGASLFDGTIQR
ncbi:hypothetical protein NDN08_005414 [Rhodosorus marinus]|uniref:Glutamate--cysteine ligase n=1 Tax=Rhodosorus marinus TaxID=101924 RepID=A0AAV8V380_9RHOD|nr:hypothetical protein NDN08_005414 [Rhodosorus marinus]